MKIAYVNGDRGTQPDRKKGAAVHVSAMRRAFRALGADVDEIDTPDPARARARLEQAHAHGPYELVYERYALGAYTGAEFARDHGVPHMLEVNAPLSWEAEHHRGGLPQGFDATREREAFGHADLVLAVSGPVATWCSERGAPAARVEVWPNAVDPDRFRPRTPADRVRTGLVPDGRWALGFHGRLRPWHNFPLLVEAVRRLLERERDVHLVIAGEGPFETHLDPLPDDRVTRVPWCTHDEIPAIVASFDVLPLTYAADAPCYFSPLKLLEAMACGAVPVVPRLGDLVEQAGAGRCSLAYTAGDTGELVAAVESLIVAPDRWSEMSRAARAQAEQRTWRDVALHVMHGRVTP